MASIEGVPKVRHARFAESWYPGRQAELASFVDASLAEATERERSGSLYLASRFAVLPHAGLMFSSRGIAPFFLHFPPQTERVLVISPSHYHLLESDVLTTGSFGAYETPLGRLKGFSLRCGKPGGEMAIEDEHAVEMVLPYLAHLQEKRKKSISVCTALVSQVRSVMKAEEIARCLFEEFGGEQLESGRTVVIASSDFTHYGFRFAYTPYAGFAPTEIFRKVKEDDLALSSLLASGDGRGALEFGLRHHSTVCGLAGGIIVSLLASHCNATGRVVDYYTSNEILENQADEFVAYSTILWS